jgi:maleate isomerase
MDRVLLGMLTPSSNTVLEPVTCDMLRGLAGVSAHFGRFAVTRIALSEGALAQFDTPGVMQAATLLSHARCQVIGWSGTSSSWLGFDADERLVRAIERDTGAKGCTSVLALNEILRRTGLRRLGLVTPYLDDVQARIVANYAAAGVEVLAERHLGLEDNFSFSEVSAGQFLAMSREVAAPKPDAIADPLHEPARRRAGGATRVRTGHPGLRQRHHRGLEGPGPGRRGREASRGLGPPLQGAGMSAPGRPRAFILARAARRVVP